MSLRTLGNGALNEDYVFFCKKFLPLVVGLNKFKSGWKKRTPISSLATASDEAFALLLLENSEIRWLSEHEFSLQKKTDENGVVVQNAEEEENLPRTKYTSAGQNKQQKGFTKRYGGWTRGGIDRYNQLFDMVVEDRSMNGTAFDQLIQNRLSNSVTGGEHEHVPPSAGPVIRARNHLFMKKKEAQPTIVGSEEVTGQASV